MIANTFSGSQLPRCKKEAQEIGLRRDTARSHATLTAIRYQRSGLEA